ncbi:MAG: hypothetical protein ABI222_10280 [Opitutaceae bacterium]
MKPAPNENNRALAAEWVRRGQALEAHGSALQLTEAVQAYDVALALLGTESLAGRPGVRHEFGVAWMNRGSALQKQATPAALADAVRAYDNAIALVQELPITTEPVFRNCLGAAWMNRGHAELQLGGVDSFTAAARSHEEAVNLLRDLPIDHLPAYRLNFTGALVNLANALLNTPSSENLGRACTLAQEALALIGEREQAESEFADLGLKARRVLCEALGHLLFSSGSNEAIVTLLADTASDAVDSGLGLARHWEKLGAPHFRPLAIRLFHFGAQLYQLHQPQFLAEFLLENLAPPQAPPAWSASEEFHSVAVESLARARQAIGRRPVTHLDSTATDRLLEISRSLARAEQRLTSLRQEFPPHHAH